MRGEPRDHRMFARFGLLVALVATPVRASSAATVVLLRTASGPQRRVEDRTRDELRLMGMQVEEINGPRDDAEIEHILAERGARAAVRIEDGGLNAVTWFPVADTRSMTTQRHSAPLANHATLALMAAETVRHKVFETPSAYVEPEATPELTEEDRAGEIPAPPPPSTSTTIPPPPVEMAGGEPANHTSVQDSEGSVASVIQESPPPTRPRGFPQERWLGVSAAVAGGPGGLRSMVGGALTAGWRVAPILTVQAEFGALASPVGVQTRTDTWHVGLATAQVLCALGLPDDRRVLPQLRIGAGPALFWASGHRSTRTEVGVGGAAILTVGANLAIRVRPRLRLNVGVDVHVFAPTAWAKFDTNEFPSPGPPFVRGAVGLLWLLPGRRAGEKR